MQIRRATYDDAAALAEIYNHYILNSTATCDTVSKNVEDRIVWLDQHSDKYPVLVCETDDHVIGYASMTRWSDRTAYDDTAEISIYLRPDFLNKGIGKKLFEAILLEGKKGGLHCVLSRITAGNDISIKMHEQFGFHMVGTMKEVGKKFGKLLDVHMMQLIYG